MEEPTKRNTRKSRIDEKAWLEAALALMAEGGVDAVRVETVSRKLGVTKGSFYKRYASRDDLLLAMLGYWRRESTLDVIETFSSIDESPPERLRRILALSERRPDVNERARMELALRLWGHSDARAAATMEEVDRIRLQFFRSVLELNGIDGQEAAARAFLTYAFGILNGALPGTRDEAMLAICRDIIGKGLAPRN